MIKIKGLLFRWDSTTETMAQIERAIKRHQSRLGERPTHISVGNDYNIQTGHSILGLVVANTICQPGQFIVGTPIGET